MNRHDRLLYLFDKLSNEQQQDLLNLMETWERMPQPPREQNDVALNPVLKESLGHEWMCLNALKRVVATHFPPRVELAYVAFHPLLDSISTAKTREAAEKMFSLEAAYELKRIFEADPHADVISEDVRDTLNEMFLQQEKR
jgi:hypothetical protein